MRELSTKYNNLEEKNKGQQLNANIIVDFAHRLLSFQTNSMSGYVSKLVFITKLIFIFTILFYFLFIYSTSSYSI